MRRITLDYKHKKKFEIKKRPQSALSPEEHINAIANLIIDRILEESQNPNSILPWKIR